MTAYGSEAIAIEVFRLGVKDYIIKPFDSLDMLDAIQRILEEAQLKARNQKLTEDLLIANSKLSRMNEQLTIANYRLQRRIKELNELHNVGETIAEAPDVETILKRVISAATMLTSSEECSVHLLENDELVCRAIKNPHNEHPQIIGGEANEMLGDPLAIEAVTSNKPKRITENANGDHDVSRAMAIPLIYANQPIGALVVKNYNDKFNRYNKFETQFLKALANYTAIAIDSSLRVLPEMPVNGDLAHTFAEKRIFISYARNDWDDYVSTVVDRLGDAGFRVWVDKDGLEGGENWLDKINEALNSCDYMVLCITPQALASLYVKFEYRYFIHEEKPLLPVICKDTRMPAELMNIQMVQFTELDRLVMRLKQIMRRAD